MSSSSSSSFIDQNQQLILLQFVSASLAACGAVTITNPFDVLKTRRQLQNELVRLNTKLTGPAAEAITLRSVFKWEGIGGLQRGLQAAYIYQILMNGVRFSIYEPTRLLLHKEARKVFGEKKADWLQFPCNVVSGAIAGATGAAIGSPFNMIKTRLQSQSPRFATGHQHAYTGIIDSISKIAGSGEGIAGFYRGVPAAVARTAVGSAVQLSTYDFCKTLAVPLGLHDSIGIHFVAALTSGLLVCVAMNPFDVIMTRLYNQSVSKEGQLYKGMWDCAKKTVSIEGYRALFKGFVPHYTRIGPHTLLNLVLLEQFRNFLRPFIMTTVKE